MQFRREAIQASGKDKRAYKRHSYSAPILYEYHNTKNYFGAVIFHPYFPWVAIHQVMLDARYPASAGLAKKGEIPYSIPAKDGISASLQQVSRNQYPVSLPNESQTSL